MAVSKMVPQSSLKLHRSGWAVVLLVQGSNPTMSTLKTEINIQCDFEDQDQSFGDGSLPTSSNLIALSLEPVGRYSITIWKPSISLSAW